MKKIIKKKTYNTDTAKKLGHRCEGSFGDPSGFEEILYQTRTGLYFIHAIGGEDSQYPAETILPLSDVQAEQWLADYTK